MASRATSGRPLGSFTLPSVRKRKSILIVSQQTFLEPRGPAVEQVVFELLRQLALGADREEACSRAGSNNRSGEIESRPVAAQSLSNSPFRRAKVALTMVRIARSGCCTGTRASRLT